MSPARILEGREPAQAFSQETASTLKQAVDLHWLMSALAAAGVDALAFKGPTLAAIAYPRLDRAASSDLDLLVRTSDVHRAMETLRGLGYNPKGTSGALGLAGNNEVALTCPGHMEVDLHWQLSPVYFFPFDLDGAFRRSQTVRLIDRDFRTLGNEDLFLGVAIHHARHCWNAHGLIRDVANLVRVRPLEWEHIERIASSSGASRVVNLAVLLAAVESADAIPAAVLRRARADRGAVRLEHAVRANLQRAGEDIAGTLAGARIQLRMHDSMRGRFRYIWRRLMLPNQTDAESMVVPTAWRPLFYLLRPLRVFGKIVRSLASQ